MSKATILANLKKNKPAFKPLPDGPSFHYEGLDVIQQFKKMTGLIGTKIIEKPVDQSIGDIIHELFPEVKQIASTIPEFSGTVNLSSIENPRELKSIDVAVLPTQLGVSENGAVWVTETDAFIRVLPFITQHLIVVLDPASIVPNMHEAYKRIKIDKTGFGVFIAGPSKRLI